MHLWKLVLVILGCILIFKTTINSRHDITLAPSYGEEPEGIHEEITIFLVKELKDAQGKDEFASRVEYYIQLNSKNGLAITKEELSPNTHDLKAQLFALDPNKDGQFTTQEARNLAFKLFDQTDFDNDGRINGTEQHIFLQNSDMNNLNKCSPVDTDKNIQLININITKSTALSDVTVSGTNVETNAVRIVVSADNKPSNLFLVSNNPTIWDITGQTDLIEKVIVTGGGNNSHKKPTNGVAGLDKDKVVIMDANCIRYWSRSGMPQENTFKQIAHFAGRAPDISASAKKAAVASINNNGVTFKKSNYAPYDDIASKAPDGFDDYVWPGFLRFYPDGLIQFKPEEVVSDRPAEKYDILPHQAGISQLVANGTLKIHLKSRLDMPAHPALEPNDPVMESPMDVFKLVKTIPHWPAELAGAHSAVFIVSRNVTPPATHADHSCVVSEITKQKIYPETFCTFDPFTGQNLDNPY